MKTNYVKIMFETCVLLRSTNTLAQNIHVTVIDCDGLKSSLHPEKHIKVESEHFNIYHLYQYEVGIHFDLSLQFDI